MSSLTRRHFLEAAALVGAGTTLLPDVLYARHADNAAADITADTIRNAEVLVGLSFTDDERELMLSNLREARESYERLRETHLPNSVVPCMVFDPTVGGRRAPEVATVPAIAWQPDPAVRRPPSDDDLAFMSVAELASILKYRRVTSVELVELYLRRLRRYNPTLEAVVTYTEDRAMRQARAADVALDAGMWLGPLHGVPWGAKDLLAVSGYPTTWGAAPYKDQILETDADVVRRLDAAGAVLIAKLTLGALAMGDVWFGGKTRNPWNPEVGSSGSSAGPGSAVAAGCVGFAIGSETLGSIVSPSNRNGVTGLRPTFGRVSRTGAMTLSWSMDKLGPMCRSAMDCALVFSAIHGAMPADPVSRTTPFSWPYTRRVQDLRVGVLYDPEYRNAEADRAIHSVLEGEGVTLRPVSLPERDTSPMINMLMAEASAAFDELIRSGRADELVRQDAGAWPNGLRAARFIPAVEYINGARSRTLLMDEMRRVFEDVDVIVTHSYGANQLAITNLTGHPSITLPNAFADVPDAPDPARRRPESITVIGDLYADDAVLAVGHLIQEHTNFHLQRPPIR